MLIVPEPFIFLNVVLPSLSIAHNWDVAEPSYPSSIGVISETVATWIAIAVPVVSSFNGGVSINNRVSLAKKPKPASATTTLSR